MADPADLLTPVEAASYLPITQPSDFDDLPQLVTAASLLCESATYRKLKRRAVTAQRFPAKSGEILRVDLFPVDPDQPVTISLDGEALTVWRKEADGDPNAFDVILGSEDPLDERLGFRNHFYRWQGWGLGCGDSPWTPPVSFPVRQSPYVVLAGWTGGYATIPDDLKLACGLTAQVIYRDWQKQETKVENTSSRPGGSKAYRIEAIPERARFILERYTPVAFPMGAA